MKEINDLNELNRLNSAVNGRVIERCAYNEDGDNYFTIHFKDGGKVVLSTLGGIEIESIIPMSLKDVTIINCPGYNKDEQINITTKGIALSFKLDDGNIISCEN